MSATQPAVVNFGSAPHSVELREVPVEEIGADDVLLEVDAVGVCGSDLHMWTGQQGGKGNYPCGLGHEFAGRIARRGANVPARWSSAEDRAEFCARPSRGCAARKSPSPGWSATARGSRKRRHTAARSLPVIHRNGRKVVTGSGSRV